LEKKIHELREVQHNEAFIRLYEGNPFAEAIDAFLLVQHLASKMGWDGAPKSPDHDFISGADSSMLNAALHQLYLVREWIEERLREGQQPIRFVIGVTGLSPRQRAAFSLIKSLSKPAKGIVIANKLDMDEKTFRRHYAPALRPHGLKNDGKGYYIA
jgi:hypothetical protein